MKDKLLPEQRLEAERIINGNHPKIYHTQYSSLFTNFLVNQKRSLFMDVGKSIRFFDKFSVIDVYSGHIPKNRDIHFYWQAKRINIIDPPEHSYLWYLLEPKNNLYWDKFERENKSSPLWSDIAYRERLINKVRKESGRDMRYKYEYFSPIVWPYSN